MKTLFKLTVNLTEKSWGAVQAASALLGDSRTDTINRAVVLYSELARLEPGKSLSYQRRRGETVTLMVVSRR